MLTEDEARTKWCPFARLWTVALNGQHEKIAPTSYNRIHGDDNGEEKYEMNHPGCRCIASDCMAWISCDKQARPQHPDDQTEPEYLPSGYCGLAGDPQ